VEVSELELEQALHAELVKVGGVQTKTFISPGACTLKNTPHPLGGDDQCNLGGGGWKIEKKMEERGKKKLKLIG
jgi:hypothetical protein